MLRKGLAIGAILWSSVAFVTPAAAVTAPAAASPRGVADHVNPADCDEIGLLGGSITVNGVLLTADQTAAMDLTDLILILAAEASGDPDADVCIDVAGLPGRPVANGHLVLCGPVEADADVGHNVNAVILVGGVPVRDGASTADTIEALQVAAAAGVEACVSADIVDNRSMVYVAPERVCATTTLRAATSTDNRTLHLVIGSTSLILGDNSVTNLTIEDPQGLLAVGEASDVGLTLLATADFYIHSGTFTISVSPATDCPVALLPDAATRSDESPLATIGLVLVTLAVACGVSGRRGRRHAKTIGA